jgi:OOP family OmpA-OmpF porin
MKKIILASLVAFAFGPAIAAEPYVGASVGRTNQKIDANQLGVAANLSTTSFKLFGGYQFDNAFGIEGGYTYFGKATLSSMLTSAWVKPDTFYVAATGRVELAPGLQGYGKLGIARPGTTGEIVQRQVFIPGNPTVELDTRRTTPMVGFGLSHSVSKELAVFAEYEYFGKAVNDGTGYLKLDNLSVGARYRF